MENLAASNARKVKRVATDKREREECSAGEGQ